MSARASVPDVRVTLHALGHFVAIGPPAHRWTFLVSGVEPVLRMGRRGERVGIEGITAAAQHSRAMLLHDEEADMTRRVVDCRDFPSETNCTLTISGREMEVLQAASEHAVSTHGHVDGPELRKQIHAMMKDEVSASA